MIPLPLRAGLRHLTVVPLAYDAGEAKVAPSRTLPWFPVIGALIGGVLWLAMQLPVPALPRAAIVLVLWTAVAGGLHEDGLMDCADAAFAPVSTDRRHAILKDPHVGAHAVTALALLLLLRFAALTAVHPALVLAAPIAGRTSMAITLAGFRPAHADGLGASFARGARAAVPITIAALLLLGISGVLRSPAPIIAFVAGLGGGLASAAFLTGRLGGVTGDVHGAAGLLAETTALYASLAWQ